VAEQKMNTEQQQLMKSLAKKVLDLLVQIAPIPKGARETYKIGRETQKALEMTDKTLEPGIGHLSASDDNLNRLSVIATRLSNELSALNRHDENWWLETSGANLFSKLDTTEALKRLQQQRQHLTDLKEACDGLKTLSALVFAQSVSNVKGLAKLYIPSIPAIDGYVTKNTRESFDVRINLINSILKKLEVAIAATADMSKSIDRFLMLINSQSQATILRALQTGGAKSTPLSGKP
jgi:hypothetical protein